MLEIIAVTLKDAIDIEQYGGDRIELVTGIEVGGLTPSIGLIEKVCNTVDIPVNVMVRPHAKSFVYDKYDEEVILRDIEEIKKTKAYGIVFGALTCEGEIDEALLKKVIHAKEHLSLTFHRAIDESNDVMKSLKTLLKYDIDRILTSGGKPKVTDAVDVIKEMIEESKNKIIILPGSGLYLDNVDRFIQDAKPMEIHMGSGVKYNKNNNENISKEAIREVQTYLKGHKL